MKQLANMVAVVTGASKGIGAGIAKGLAVAGAHVVVNYASSKTNADKVVADIAAAGGKATAVKANVTNEAELTALFEQTEKAFGKVDILVNNAGVWRFEPLERVTAEDFHYMFDTNVLGIFLSCREALKHFNADGGSIINIGSIAGTLAPPGYSVYCAAKGALDIITKSLSKELAGRNIRVNSMKPGMVDRERKRENGLIGTPIKQHILNSTLLGRIGQPDDIADVAVFLASEQSRFMTGEILRVTG